MSDNIKVVVKVRPLISREIEEKLSYQWRVKSNTLYQLDQNGKDLGQSFTFDKVYDEHTKTSDVYNDIAKPIVQAATAGFNGTIFAYGQTSSGKTYTMTGTESSPGIIPLAVLNLFEIIRSIPDRDFLVRVSYIEIYNETVKDLLNVEKEHIKVHETHQGIKVDASEKVTSSPEEVLEIMKEGEANRQMGATNMNENSSRSHSIFQITIESREHTEGESEGGCVNVSQLNLVDLAGSERAGQTGATGLRFKEGTHINKSLSALALVIKQLSEDPNKYANYRDSKLTRILQNSLGGNAKTSIVCAVTPAAVEETISTLQFANRAKAIKNKPEVNAVATTDDTMIQRLTKQMCKLQAQLESKKNLEQDNYNLQKQITALQRLILNGFAQRRSIDMMQCTRRKLQQPRRVTIHSTVSTIEDEPVVNIPKFCTPSLKYNPLSIPNPSEFVPIQSSNKLASVPEEPVRLITPPPRRAVNFKDEVIELDSDDDSVHGDHETCSPIHKCYGASKTPPCILRKNAKLAEKNLRDIVELTEREKIYSPSTVELMEKLEQNATVIAKLQDEIEIMGRRSKEKDLEVDLLKNKIKKNEEELNALISSKKDLQVQCDNFSTKLTDWEVSYETLKNKARLREDELLSLLDEVKIKKTEDIGKILSRTLDKEVNFMDMSKDISLVNSDNENSVMNPDDVNNISQIATNQNVVELEANLFAHKQKITSLENLTQELEQTISTFKEKLNNMEEENLLLRNTVDNLNTTISNQKDSLKSANEDITSYNHVIQELQIKLTQKESLPKLDINDSVLEQMLANEQQVIANNDNIVNIIQCFKNALDVRNKEISDLKAKMDNNSSSNKDLLDELQTKTEHINKINLEVDDLKKQTNENITLINKLMHENNNHKIVEDELSAKIIDLTSKNGELEKNNKDNVLCIEKLKSEIDSRASETCEANNNLIKEIQELNKQITELEASANEKDDLISSLNKDKAENALYTEQLKAEIESKKLQVGEVNKDLTKQIQELNKKVTELEASANEKDVLISSLNQDKATNALYIEELKAKIDKRMLETGESNNNLIKEIEELNKQITELEASANEKDDLISSLNKDKESNALYIEELKAKIDKRMLETGEANNNLIKEIEELNKQITELEASANEKDDLISSLNKDKAETEENMLKAKTAVVKSQTIIGTLSGNMQEMPEIIDSFVNIFSALSESLNILETTAADIVTEKEEAIKAKNSLKSDLEAIQAKYDSEVKSLHEQIDNLSKLEYSTKQENNILTETIERLESDVQTLRNESNDKTLVNTTLEAKLNEAIEIRNLEKTVSKTKQEQFEQILLEKDTTISNMAHKLEDIENALKEKLVEIITLETHLNEARVTNHDYLTNILKKIINVTDNFNSELRGTDDVTDSMEVHERILLNLNKIENHITFIKLKNDDVDNDKITEILNEAKKEIAILTEKNLNLEAKLSDIERMNNDLLLEIEQNQDNNKKLSDNLKGSQDVLQDLQAELKVKASELASMKDKVKDWKEQFEDLDDIMKQQMSELKVENDNLKSRIDDLRRESSLSIAVYDSTEHIDAKEDVTTCTKAADLTTNADTSSPPSLLTICCNKIVDFIEPKESESKTTTNSSIEVENQTEVAECRCKYLKLELEAAKEDNSRLIDLLAQLEIVNEHLLHEQDVVRSEIQLLVQPAHELQKKIANHKTNLSILTATTYAENKSLKSQVKVLQHHHKRFHNVCQRDIPDFKKQLSSLMSILKGDPTSCDQQNVVLKRYSLPDVLDNSTALPNFKNESTLDGDLLMLDTNVTLTTAADNTLMGPDQTCLDITQFYLEASCQTNDLNQTIEQNAQHNNVFDQLSTLKEENIKLRELVDKFSEVKKVTIDAQNSPIKNGNHLDEVDYKMNVDDQFCETFGTVADNECVNCKDLAELKDSHDKLNTELQELVMKLKDVMSQKATLEQKYNSLSLETPSTDALVKKLSIFEKEYNGQKQEIAKLNNTINIKNKELKILQEENDTLSNQLMENISEADNLNKDLDNLKQERTQLIEKCHKLEQSTKDFINKPDDESCSQCVIKDKLIQAMQNKTNTHTRLNRSLSDSDTSSRYNKICTLQSELHAGREDCKELTEDVVTIKNHLERSNLSMDLDESMTDVNNYTFKDFDLSNPESNKRNMPDIPEECTTDIYGMDKTDCLNYYAEKTGVQKDTLNRDVKIIEFMKMLYENLITKHGNEVENLTNKLKDYEEANNELKKQYYNLVEKQTQLNNEMEERDGKFATVASTLSQIRNSISNISETLNNATDANKTKLVNEFKESLALLDREFDFVSVNIFESVIDNIVQKHQSDLSSIMDKYSKLQENMETVTTELNSVYSTLQDIKTQLSAKENEYNLLKAQKERVHEITNAVTLDIVKREKELKDTIDNGYKRLIELSIVKPEHVNTNIPLNNNINVLFELLVTKNEASHRDKEHEKEALLMELNTMKSLVEEKLKEIDLLKTRNEKSQEVNNGVTLDLIDKDNKLKALMASYTDLNKQYEDKVAENNAHALLNEKLSEEVNTMKSCIVEKENIVQRLQEELTIERQHNIEITKMSEVIETSKYLQDENAKLKSLNEIINKEKDSYAEELKKSGETIKKNNIDLDKMMSDILVLRESVKENSSVIENLSAEAKSLLKQNMELKEQLESKCRECSRLETNIKTHEKTAQIQTRMIMRLEKQKTDDDKALSETKQQLEELSQKYTALVKDSDTLKLEVESLSKVKADLEARTAELESTLEGYRGRPSLDAIADSSRRRRQSLRDSQRTFAEDKHEVGDHNGVEAVFNSRPKPDDLFMDVDEYGSNRSTPIRLSKGRDSLSQSRTDQTRVTHNKSLPFYRRKLQPVPQGKLLSDKDEEHPSRPSSVLDTRRRRQTIHDSHRNSLSHTPSPYGDNDSSTVSQLRKRLSACQQELEDLKEKYRELDEECETCAEYLKERDAQCARLKKEKLSLQTTITELKEKLQTCNPNVSHVNASKPNVAHASVNTDEDWTNLHSLVVDRMSYNAEVEKNKKLSKTIEELRFKKQDLKNTLAKMQKAFEKNAGNRELEATKQELQSCKQELAQLKQKYKELDEECEICGQYLREREEQCRRLKEAKAALEAKLQELQSAASPVTQTARKKRQSAHDLNRAAVLQVADAATETSDDFLSYQVERDSNSRSKADDKHAKEVKYLKLAVERLSQQKSSLEAQLAAVTSHVPALPAMYVATGSAIVQNQQITDVMKENQKLKNINAKLIHICKKRGKDSNRENEDPADQG